MFNKTFKCLFSLSLLVLIILSIADSSNAKDSDTWPSVQPYNQLFIFENTEMIRKGIRVEFKDTKGAPLFHLICHSGPYEKVVINTDADFHCRLFKPDGSDYSTLITENYHQAIEWEDSRATFSVYELMGACADYPEYGKERHYRLQGVKLTLKMSEIKFIQEPKAKLNSFHLEVSIEPDQTAKSGRLLPVSYLEPRLRKIKDSSGNPFDCTVLRKQQIAWPQINPVTQSFLISDPSKPFVKTFIKTVDGKEFYLFICRNGEDKTHGEDFNYSGAIDCRLMEAEGGEKERNLLVESKDLSPWYSRGRMFFEELYGDCANYPEYGHIRHFKLRQMKITMEFNDVQFKKDKNELLPLVTSYSLRLTVEPDKTAKTEIAELSGYLDPSRQVPGHSRSCQKVLKGNEWKD